MIVMPGNDRGAWWGYLAGIYPGRIGSLFSPGYYKNPVPFAPYAIDNGAFTGFNERAFLELCDKVRKAVVPPLWVAVPDSVGNKEETLRLWSNWEPRLLEYKWPLAFVVQDGMTPDNVPSNASCVFVGGSTALKWRHLKMWTSNFPNVHVGRVNTERNLWTAQDHGAKSCDGTGWFRNITTGLPKLIKFLEGRRDSTTQMNFS